MPTLLLLIIAVLLLSSSPVLAEDFPRFNQVRGVLQYEGFNHWLNTSYDYSYNKTANSSSSNHALQESYNTSLQFALFDPRIFDANLQGIIDFDQNWSKDSTSSSGSSTSYQYNFSGSGLNKSRIPFTLLSFHTTDTVQNTFTPPTTTDTAGNEFGISFLNDKLKSNFHYARNSTDSKTAGISSSSTSNMYMYTAEHLYGTFSTTSFSAAFSDQSGGTSNGERLTSSNNSLGLSNSLRFGTQKNYSLLSQFQLSNSMTDKLPLRNFTYSEAFDATLGRALYLNTTYTLTNYRSTDLAGQIQENTQNQGDISITHKLFESLNTELHGTADLNKNSDGTDDRYSVWGDTTYNKKISTGSNLMLGVRKGYDLVDRNVSSGMTTVRDERHATVHQGDVIQLALADGTLRSVSAVTSRNPIFTYIEGVDYTVNYTLGRITILSGGGVRIDMDGTGTDLYITYTLYKDPKLKYSSDTLSLTSGLSLLDSRLNIGASWSKSGQTVISGPALNSLQNSRSLSLYISGNYNPYFASFAYRNLVVGDLTSQAFEGNVMAHWQTANANFSLTARDTYNVYDATLNSVAYWDNNADMTISYSRYLMSNTMLTLQGNANDSRAELQPTKDSLSLRVNSQTVFNKITINLNGQTAWIFDQNGTTRNDSVHVDLTRYF